MSPAFRHDSEDRDPEEVGPWKVGLGDGALENPADRVSLDNGDDCDDLTRRHFLKTVATASSLASISTFAAGDFAAGDGPTATGSKSGKPQSLALQVNRQTYHLELEPRVTLLDALREQIGLTGTKKGCDHGQCGACTVLVNGRRIYSCLTLAAMHAGGPITTVEGLANGETLHPVQAAFIEHDGFQCGYCTSGQICSAVGLIAEGHAHTDDEIRELMSGNLCRCGCYSNIVQAVHAARDVLAKPRS
ncbi:MAG TPA: 2Fe-2S iron-sulfur cluster-binding protein [Pirellulales bacterium]|jgi:xanthine dehydrogenase YagT iron-sulfur-binding subunit|nr:2Fe-2S iron-sulfur cluster-binding protein [Pirellulales bacterium]